MNPAVSIIIPTFNRAPILEETLRALCEQQRGSLPTFEVIVVNDGSTDGTGALLDRLVGLYHPMLTAVHQPNLKQGMARNHGMQTARGGLLAFLGDDIIPHERFLDHHWGRFVRDGQPRRYAAIGRILWHPAIRPTPFREWIHEWGLQFGFRLITDPEHVPFNFFYTANLAFSRDLYDDLGGFSERFKGYGWEDIELGYRYQMLGNMRLRYVEEALAYHHHRLTVTGFCRRQRRVGYASMVFYEMYPELREFLHVSQVGLSLKLTEPFLGLLARLIEYGDEDLGLNLNRYTEKILAQYYRLGMLEWIREARDSPRRAG